MNNLNRLHSLTDEIMRRQDLTGDHIILIEEMREILSASTGKKRVASHKIAKSLNLLNRTPDNCDLFGSARQVMDIMKEMHSHLEALFWQRVKEERGVN